MQPEQTITMNARHLTTRPSLLARVRDAHDEEGWREFFAIYKPLLYRYARLRGLGREEAEELTQQCLVVLAEKMPQFEYAREKGGFKHWLRRLANNKINDHFRKRRVPLARTADFLRPQDRELTLGELWEREWQRKHMQHFLQQIRREVARSTYHAFELHVLSEWPVARVAETLDLSADQVYAAKSRITRRLREKMREAIGE